MNMLGDASHDLDRAELRPGEDMTSRWLLERLRGRPDDGGPEAIRSEFGRGP